MKEKSGLSVNDAFNVLLCGLPQGVLLGLVWIAYSAWTTLTMRGVLPFQSFSRLK